MFLFFEKRAPNFPRLPQQTLNSEHLRQGCPGLKSIYLPAVVGGFCFDFEAQPYKYERVREPCLGNTLLRLFELLPNIWDLFKHTILLIQPKYSCSKLL